MDPLFPFEINDVVTPRVEKIDTLLQSINQVLSELRISLDRNIAIEQRVGELESSVARLQSIIMDLRNTSTIRSEGGDRLASLEGMVTKLCTLTAEQKAALDHLAETQGRSIQELKKEIHQRSQESDEPVVHEIEELVRRR